MSRSTITKASAILVGLSILATSISTVIALDSTTSSVRPVVKPVIKKEATSSVAPRKQAVQQKVENIKEKIASREAALRLKLQTFKDKKKAEVADRVNTNLNKVNQNQTAQMLKHLDKMSAILDKLESRVESGKPDIKDPTAARTAIASARAAIVSASAAVTTQSQKDYTITVFSEGRIGLDAKVQRDKLHTDLLALRKIVIDAKQSVTNAIRIAKSGPVPTGTGLKKEGTSSGKQ